MANIYSSDLAIFLMGTLAAAFVTGLAGFAFGMVAAGVWLFALTPSQTSALIVAYGVLVQGYAAWKLRHAIRPHRLAPFIVGSAIGIPAGVAALGWISPVHFRIGVGVLLIVFSLYNLVRPKLSEMKAAGRTADATVGFFNGVLGGATGLGGILPTIWSGLRGWPRDEQRAVFQPTAVATFLMTIATFGSVGIITYDTVRLFMVGLPPLVAGSWLGWLLYGKLDEGAFRKVVLVLLLVSGVTLVASAGDRLQHQKGVRHMSIVTTSTRFLRDSLLCSSAAAAFVCITGGFSHAQDQDCANDPANFAWQEKAIEHAQRMRGFFDPDRGQQKMPFVIPAFETDWSIACKAE